MPFANLSAGGLLGGLLQKQEKEMGLERTEAKNGACLRVLEGDSKGERVTVG